MKEIQVKDIKCEVVVKEGSSKVAYLIYPAIEGLSDALQQEMSNKYGINVVTVYVPADEWNNYLTPWPEPPEEKGFEPFGGKAHDFKELLEKEIVPEAEKMLGTGDKVERTLTGVSLSGLFTLWDWLQSDLFHNIGVLSGSFWYKGFMEWFDALTLPSKTGKAYFLLGTEEPKAKIEAYRSVGENTEAIVKRLKNAGFKVKFDWVPGNHFSDPIHRLKKTIASLYTGF